MQKLRPTKDDWFVLAWPTHPVTEKLGGRWGRRAGFLVSQGSHPRPPEQKLWQSDTHSPYKTHFPNITFIYKQALFCSYNVEVDCELTAQWDRDRDGEMAAWPWLRAFTELLLCQLRGRQVWWAGNDRARLRKSLGGRISKSSPSFIPAHTYLYRFLSLPSSFLRILFWSSRSSELLIFKIKVSFTNMEAIFSNYQELSNSG